MEYNAEKKVEKEFALVNNIIERHWNRAIGLANAESLMTYWTVGAFVSARLRQAQWGAKTVEALCDYLKTHNPKRRGFGKRQIYNMVQFYDTYTLPEYQVISERLRLHEFVQMPSAQIEGCEIVHSANAQLSTMSPIMVAEYRRLLIPEEVMKKSLVEYCEFMKNGAGHN